MKRTLVTVTAVLAVSGIAACGSGREEITPASNEQAVTTDTSLRDLNEHQARRDLNELQDRRHSYVLNGLNVHQAER